MTLAGVHSAAKMSHVKDRASVSCELGVNDTGHNLNSVAGVMSCCSAFLLKLGSAEALAGPESATGSVHFCFPA